MFKSTLRTPRTAASVPVVALRDVRKVYGRGEGAVVALDGVSVAFAPGSFTALMGPSGSGKSTFLNVAAGLDRPTSGTVGLGDTDLAGVGEGRVGGGGGGGAGGAGLGGHPGAALARAPNSRAPPPCVGAPAHPLDA